MPLEAPTRLEACVIRRDGLLLLALVVALVFGALGVLAYKRLPDILGLPPRTDAGSRWPVGFSTVDIESSADHSKQKAIFRAARNPKRPLLISLHVWAGDYRSPDPLAVSAAQEDWNYIHPDFRGPNHGVDNCLSDKVVADISDAIDYGVLAGRADPEQIFVVGFSGGAYAAIGIYARARQRVRAFLVWSPISDLGAWHEELRAHGDAEVARQ